MDDHKLAQLLPADAVATLRDEVEMARGLCPDFNLQSYREGHLTPVFFGSAINNFGVRELLQGLGNLAPSPRPQPAKERTVEPTEEKVSGFVFKIQANMDPQHRDRVAFMRVCSGNYKKGMKMRHVRIARDVQISNAITFMASDREQVETAYPGDIIGLHNHGTIQIGDTFSQGKEREVHGYSQFRTRAIPSCAPERPNENEGVAERVATIVRRGGDSALQAFQQ